jgi:hypothetical protein
MTDETHQDPSLEIPPQVTPEKRTRINLQLSQATHRRIKVYCVQRSTTMQAALEAMLDKAFEAVKLQ